MSFIKNIFFTFSSRILIIIIGMISGIIVARTLGPEGRGIFAVLAVITGIAVQIGNLGFHASNTYFIAKDHRKTPQILSNSLWIGLVVGFFIALIIYYIAKFYPFEILGVMDRTLLNITLISIPFLLLSLFFQNILLGRQKIFLYNIIQILTQLAITVGVIILLLIFRGDILSLIILSTAVSIVVAIVYWIVVAKEHGFKFNFDVSLFQETFKYGIKSYIASFLAYLILRSDIYILNLLKGVAETGIYSLAAGFGDMIYILPVIIGTILFPKVSEASENEKGFITAKVSRHVTFIMFIFCLVSAFLAKPLIVFLYGKNFLAAFTPFLVLLPGIFFWSISNIFMNHFAGKGLPLIVIWSPLAALLINVIINIIYIPTFGMMAASISSSIAYGLVFLINLIYFNQSEGVGLRETLIIQKSEIINLMTIVKNKIRL